MLCMVWIGLTLCVCMKVGTVCGHGRLWEPPSRSSMWRRGFNTSINIDDNELSCGGFTNQWILNGGRCGVCGDPYQQKPRDNEHGGKYASGLIPRTYPVGSVMEVVIGLTANHGGYFEFRLCPLNGQTAVESQRCMEQHKLTILIEGQYTDKYYIRNHMLEGEVRMSILLPPDLRCKHCVLQWKYRTGTRWGCNTNGECRHGLGPQEEFYGCSDIAISDVPKTIYLVPKQPGNEDKVGLNDLGSILQRNMKLNSHDVKFVSYKIPSYVNASDPAKAKETPTSESKMDNHLQDNIFMENLLLRSIRAYYNSNKNRKLESSKQCMAVLKYQGNPIINEWCRNICLKHSMLCLPSVCKCNKDVLRQQIVQVQNRNIYTDNQETLLTFAKELINKTNTHNATQNIVHESKANILKNIPVPSDFINSKKVTLITTTGFEGENTKSSDFDMGRKEVQHPLNLINYLTTKTDMLPKMGKTDIGQSVMVEDSNSSQVIHLSGITCTASKKFAHNEYMTKWCTKNCSFGFCPKSVCSCTT